MREESAGILSGVVTSRRCPHCGHHEIGYETREGTFRALTPGTFIQVLDPEETGVPLSPFELEGGEHGDSHIAGDEEQSRKAYIPPPLRGDKTSRLKYGVMVRADHIEGKMAPEVYHFAYLRKLERLIEKELVTPLPVILDRYFAAAHLASGNPRQVSQAMWRELEEIRSPALLMSVWLERGDEESLMRMIYPRSRETLEDHPVNDEDMANEQEGLSLDAFLELLSQ